MTKKNKTIWHIIETTKHFTSIKSFANEKKAVAYEKSLLKEYSKEYGKRVTSLNILEITLGECNIELEIGELIA